MEMQICIKCNKPFEVSETEKRWKKMCKECYIPKQTPTTVEVEKPKETIELGIGKNQDAAFGSIFGHSVTMTLQIMENSQGMGNFEETFNKSFEKLWSLMIQKRKEKFHNQWGINMVVESQLENVLLLV